MQYLRHSFTVSYQSLSTLPSFTSKSLTPIYGLLRQIKQTVFVGFAHDLPSIGSILLREAYAINPLKFRFTLWWNDIKSTLLTIYSKEWIFNWEDLLILRVTAQESIPSLSDWLNHWYVQRNEWVKEYPCESDNVSEWLKR